MPHRPTSNRQTPRLQTDHRKSGVGVLVEYLQDVVASAVGNVVDVQEFHADHQLPVFVVRLCKREGGEPIVIRVKAGVVLVSEIQFL